MEPGLAGNESEMRAPPVLGIRAKARAAQASMTVLPVRAAS